MTEVIAKVERTSKSRKVTEHKAKTTLGELLRMAGIKTNCNATIVAKQPATPATHGHRQTLHYTDTIEVSWTETVECPGE